MAVFQGKLLEESLDFIRIDGFHPNNYDGTSFFVSNFHTDCIQEIYSEGFLEVLNKNKATKLYCSAFTKAVILRKEGCQIPSSKIFALGTEPHLIEHKDRHPVLVTTIPAGHCPGSVMFLFEQEDLKILYTGDFRINPVDLQKMRVLREANGEVKKLNCLYLDTSFCNPEWLSFPPCEQTLIEILDLITIWLEADPAHQVGILYKSYHGLESLLIQIARNVDTDVWVIDDQSFENYRYIPELQDRISLTKNDSKIHVCPVATQDHCSQCCEARLTTRTIVPCAMSFNHQQPTNNEENVDQNVTRVGYSTHCSLEELISIVQYLSPEKVYPCVIPPNSSVTEVLENLMLDVDQLKLELSKINISSYTTSQSRKRYSSLSSDDGFLFATPTPESSEDEEEEARSLSDGDMGFGIDHRNLTL